MNFLASSIPPSKYMAAITASKASAKIEILSLPPVASSPFPSNKKFPKLISSATSLRDSSHTIFALNFVNSPSGSSFSFLNK